MNGKNAIASHHSREGKTQGKQITKQLFSLTESFEPGLCFQINQCCQHPNSAGLQIVVLVVPEPTSEYHRQQLRRPSMNVKYWHMLGRTYKTSPASWHNIASLNIKPVSPTRDQANVSICMITHLSHTSPKPNRGLLHLLART